MIILIAMPMINASSNTRHDDYANIAVMASPSPMLMSRPAESTDEEISTDESLIHQSSTRPVHLGKVIVIKDTAFAT
jgi:hypothetical protein